MKISKDQLKRIIKEELDDASAHTIATGGETIENPKMPTGFGHYAGKGRYEDWNTAGSGDRAREEDLESIRLAGDIGEKPEPQQRYDISDETGAPVLRSDLDDALASLSKDQVEQIIREVTNKISGQTLRRSTQGPEGSTRNLSQTIQDVSDEETVNVRRAIASKDGDVKGEHSIDVTKKDGEEKSLASRFKGDVESLETSVPREKTNQPIQLPGQEKSLKITSGGQELKFGDEGYFDAQKELGYPGLPEAGETGEERYFVQDPDVSELGETLKRWKKLIK